MSGLWLLCLLLLAVELDVDEPVAEIDILALDLVCTTKPNGSFVVSADPGLLARICGLLNMGSYGTGPHPIYRL